MSTDQPRTLEERAALLCRTPAELAEIDAMVDQIHRERTLAPDLAAKYDSACERIAEYHDETVRYRRRIQDLEEQLDARWEQGRLHGLRQAHRPGDARARQLEAEIEGMLTIEEGNSRAWLAKCEKVRELEANLARVQALADRRWVAWQSARRGRSEATAGIDALLDGQADARAQLDIEQHNHASERNMRQAAYAEIADLRAQLATTTNPRRAETRLTADAHPTSTCGCGHPHAAHWGESASGCTECMTAGCPCDGSDVPQGPRSPNALASDTEEAAGDP